MRRSHNAPKEPKDYESWGLLYSWGMLVTQAGGTIYIYIYIYIYVKHCVYCPQIYTVLYLKQSEVSQKEKHQYSILTHIYGI